MAQRVQQLMKLVKDAKQLSKRNQMASRKLTKKVAKDEKAIVISKQMPAPVALSYAVKNRPPKISSHAGVTTVEHFELIDSVITTTTSFLNAVNIPIQPGSLETFPWLAQMAKLFKKYRFNSLKFVFIPFCSSSTAGTIELAVDFDPANPQPAIEQDLVNYTAYKQSNVWTKVSTQVNCKDMHKGHEWLLVRPLAYAGQISSLANYDAGRFYAFTNNGGTNTNCGKMYVEYDISFMDPVLPPAGVLIGLSAKSVSGTTTGNPMGTGGVSYAVGSAGIVINPPPLAPGNTYISFSAPGTYTFEFFFTGVNVSSFTIAAVAGFTNPNTVVLTNTIAGGGGSYSASGYIQVVDDQSIMQIGAVATSISGCFLNINQSNFQAWF